MSGTEDELRDDERAADEPVPGDGADGTEAPVPGEGADTPEPGPDAPAVEREPFPPDVHEAVDLVEMFGLYVIEVPDGVDRETFARLPDCPVCNGFAKVPHAAPQDPHAKRCPDCEGHGVVVTGSFVPGHEQRDCPTCLGQGYVADVEARAAVRAPALQPGPDGSGYHPVGEPPWEGAVWDAERAIWRDRADVEAVSA